MDTRAARTRVPPERDPAFDHLRLEDLRDYRQALAAEENRVSYWRRIIQARLDLVRATNAGGPPTLEHLRGVLTGSGMGTSRNALVQVLPVDDMPPLPNLGALWDDDPVPGDDAHNAALLDSLADAERQLSAYRAALHRRIAAATGELIARYREHPGLCLTALPQRPPLVRSRAVGAS